MSYDILQECLLLNILALAVECEQLLNDGLPCVQKAELCLSIDRAREHWHLVFV